MKLLTLAFIFLSHPEMLPLHWSQSCGVEKSFDSQLPSGSLLHNCDTNPGSSGAVLLNSLTLKIVGIHDGGYADDKHVGMNYGTYVLNSPMTDKLIELGFK